MENAVRDTNEETTNRAVTRPETMFANGYMVDMAASYWASALRGDKRVRPHPAAYADCIKEERAFTRVDEWKPYWDDNLGRCLPSWNLPDDNPPVHRDTTDADTDTDVTGDEHILKILNNIQKFKNPNVQQCETILQYYFRQHEVDEDMTDWHDLWQLERGHHKFLSLPREMRLSQEYPDSVDYSASVGFQIYRSFKLGSGTSVVGDTLLYTRTSKTNYWFRYTSYNDPDLGDSDAQLDFRGAIQGRGGRASLTKKMHQVCTHKHCVYN